MERKIGEIFEFGGEWYQCLESPTCNCKHCDFYDNKHNLCHISPQKCLYRERSDKKDVIFKKLEKVGEPHFIEDEIFEDGKVYVQNFKVYKDFEGHKPICNDYILYDWKNRIISIEIKQNKEDMEEKGQCGDNRFEIIAKAKEALLKETNIARDEQEMAVIDNILFRCWQMGWLDKYDDTKHSNSESIGKNLKPFSLEAAKAGKPVCTRDGRKARIICFDRIDSTGCNLSIVALIQCGGTEVSQLYCDDGKRGVKSDLDLMMLPEKKEGWVNVYQGGKLDTKSYPTKKEAFDKASPKGYVDTIKINWSE